MIAAETLYTQIMITTFMWTPLRSGFTADISRLGNLIIQARFSASPAVVVF